ncbi:hypothetical protein NNO95_03895 [Acinetobacter baumannii]|uniref:hypothetical protein n=1 Tax=Acinetobacter baumannii TaxID=470 RepID=UPI0020CCDC47|nr:hypothetical protein [Acinetobacter baumannii]MCQ1053520.1 hypothetical protein [Acinetobacter baumannii]
MARQIKTPGAATTSEPTVEDVKTPEANQTVEQQPADTTTPEQTAADSTESEPTVDAVDYAARIAELEQQLAEHAAPRVAELEQMLADQEAKNKALEGQLRRAGTTKPTEAAKTDAVPTDGSPYLSDKGWTRGA